MTLFNDKDKQKAMLKWCGFKYTLTKFLHENKRNKEYFTPMKFLNGTKLLKEMVILKYNPGVFLRVHSVALLRCRFSLPISIFMSYDQPQFTWN